VFNRVQPIAATASSGIALATTPDSAAAVERHTASGLALASHVSRALYEKTY